MALYPVPQCTEDGEGKGNRKQKGKRREKEGNEKGKESRKGREVRSCREGSGEVLFSAHKTLVKATFILGETPEIHKHGFLHPRKQLQLFFHTLFYLRSLKNIRKQR